MNSTRLWAIGSVTVMIVALLAGWFLGIQPNLAAAAANDVLRVDIEAQNTAKQAEIASLAEENSKIDSIEKEYRELQKSIPSTTDPAAFITALDALAASTGVQVAGITVDEPRAYTVPASGAAPAPTSSETPAPDAAAPAPVAPVGPVAVTSPLITPDNFVGISVGVQLKGTYEAVLSYVKGLQSGDRLVLVTGFTSTAEPDSGLVSAHIDGMIYVLKQSQ